MNKINELIKTLGKDDIERISLGSLMTRIKEKNYDNSNILTVYSVTKEKGIVKSDDLHDFSVYSNDLSNYYILRKNQYAYNPARLNIGSIARLKNDEPGLVSPMYVVFELNDSKINYDYFDHLLFSKKIFNDMCSFVEQGARFRFDYKNWDKMYIDLPPIEVQEKIVKILDKFGELEAELEAELEVRKSQYEFWRRKLMKLENIECESIPLSKVYEFKYGTGNAIPDIGGDYPVYGSNGIVGTHNEWNSEDAPVIGHIGAYAGIINWAPGKHFVTYNGVICKKINDNVDARYAYYLLRNENFLGEQKGAQPFVSYDALKKPIVKIPDISIQRKIAGTLDKFDALINDITEGIPAEIELRRQQYEYYRNRLLSFEELINE